MMHGLPPVPPAGQQSPGGPRKAAASIRKPAMQRSQASIHSMSHLKLLFSKIRGGAACPPRANLRQIVLSSVGGFIGIAAVAYLASANQSPLMLGSFGATCLLMFGFPDNPFSQPRNVIAGHFLSSFVGLAFLALLGTHWWSLALAASAAISLMQMTRTVHPPACSNPLLIMLSTPKWDFLFFPTLTGAVILVVVAVLFNNLMRRRAYPKYWM
jgi:CBS-domain-containing membrane protein